MSQSAPVKRTSALPSALLRLSRPRQWPKNLVVLAALLFTGRFLEPQALGLSLLALLAFILLSASVYAVNDARDAESDRDHPEKRLRPVAAGELKPGAAYAWGLALALGGLALLYALGPWALAVGGAYLALTALYTLWGKHQVALDVLLLAMGFVLRAAAGAVALDAKVSAWLLLCATLLALFLALAKRRHELATLGGKAARHRASLAEYDLPLLDQMIAICAGSTVVSYALYASMEHPWRGQPVMMLTLPFVIYAVFRYLYLIQRKGLGGRPEEALLSDRPLLIAILLWGAASGALLLLQR